AHTDDYTKNGDTAQVTATVTDDDPAFGASNVVANLTGLGGGSAVSPDDYTGGVATWNLASVVCAPADGTVTVTVTATDPISNVTALGDDIVSDNTAPGVVTGLAAAPAHQEVGLSWEDPTGLDTNYCGVVVRHIAWDDYPYYVTSAPPYPADELSGDGEAFDGTGLVTSATHSIVDRDIYYYSAFVYDGALHYGGVDSGGQDRSTNYWLGDVANTGDNWVPDGLVTVHDINKLAGTYGVSPPVGYNNSECDVGPTDDHSRVGIPEPDGMIQFEDLMIFSMNYGVVAAKVVPFLVEPGVGDLALALVENGRTNGGVLELALRLEGNAGDVKGLTAELEFEGLEYLSARLSNDMSSPMADMFFWSNATSHSVQVDAAVLGTDMTIGGSGDVVLFSFQVLDETYAVDFTSAELRGASNEDLTAELEGLSSEGVPVAFKLVQNSPNPFNPVTKVAYHVPRKSEVTIRVYDVSGRVVTTLVDGVVEAGRHAAVWNGRNDAGESVGSGIYFCTMEAPDFHDSRKMTLLK
ncbi:MAG: T9SS type A sorting domain-containing protein, partial [Candidatus Eisenbacteria sp.]|nr:T9SS type A sorting domain-containing protein [Candidatus Eisenbacteria bacterium]